MKKAYKKPVLIVEQFTLSQTIAQGCGQTHFANFVRLSTCGWEIAPGFVVFSQYPQCNFPTEEFDGVCYNAPEAGMNVFHS